MLVAVTTQHCCVPSNSCIKRSPPSLNNHGSLTNVTRPKSSNSVFIHGHVGHRGVRAVPPHSESGKTRSQLRRPVPRLLENDLVPNSITLAIIGADVPDSQRQSVPWDRAPHHRTKPYHRYWLPSDKLARPGARLQGLGGPGTRLQGLGGPGTSLQRLGRVEGTAAGVG